MNNLQIELKRHKLQQQFLELIEFGNHSQQGNSQEVYSTTKNRLDTSADIHSPQTKPYGGMEDASSLPPEKMLSFADDKVKSCNRNINKELDKTEDTSLILNDTEQIVVFN